MLSVRPTVSAFYPNPLSKVRVFTQFPEAGKACVPLTCLVKWIMISISHLRAINLANESIEGTCGI